MNDDENYMEFSAISLNILNSNKITRDLIFYFLLLNTIFALISLTLILNPSNLIRHYFLKFVHISLLNIKLYHVLILIIGFYSYLYFSLKDAFDEIDTDTFQFVLERFVKFNMVYEIESKVWLVFIIIICLLSIYRQAYLINKEEKLNNI